MDLLCILQAHPLSVSGWMLDRHAIAVTARGRHPKVGQHGGRRSSIAVQINTNSSHFTSLLSSIL